VKTALVVFLFAASTFAQNRPPACGPDGVSFNLTLNQSHASPPRIEAGNSLVYFIRDNGRAKYGLGIHVIPKIGIDGAWVGAIKDNSFVSVPVQPGEHHICVNLDSTALGNYVEFAHFTAEAGKVPCARFGWIPTCRLFTLNRTFLSTFAVIRLFGHNHQNGLSSELRSSPVEQWSAWKKSEIALEKHGMGALGTPAGVREFTLQEGPQVGNEPYRIAYIDWNDPCDGRFVPARLASVLSSSRHPAEGHDA